ncbi:MAG: WhiB family transcriptional regulator [Actinomycetota bacterium]|nr:WhiB family transcriptional regulator [Actinomycetota bacterium]
MFFSEDLHDIARAKHLCGTCALRRPCLDAALARQEPCGVWGGELLSKGRVLAHKRRRGRPPKRRPAEVIVIDGVDVVVSPEIRSA